MNQRVLWIFFLLMFGSNLYGQNYPAWDFRFPLDIEAAVSGSFGELRNDHFHSGVDFTTHGKTGLPIYSIEDGYVSRIAVSPSGFGKALYIAHPNGYTSVYAHLESFNSEIEKVVLNFQYEKESFQINEYLKPDQLPVKRGEVIALSGNSGSSGGPHLHFEIRETVAQKPLNVHQFGLPTEDDRPPHIEAVAIYPLAESSTINGQKEPLHLPVVFHSGRFHLRGNPTINAHGPIGIGVETFDYYSNSWRKCGVYSIELTNNQLLVFRSKVDGFLFSDTRYLNSHIDYARKTTTGKRIQKSFLDINNQLDIYTTNSARGAIDVLPFSENNLEYTITDDAGNRSMLSFKVTGVNPSARGVGTFSLVKKINPKEVYKWAQDGYEITIPANTFYTEITPSFAILSRSGLDSQIEVLDATIPFHRFFELLMPIPEEYLNETKITAAYVDKRGRASFAGGQVEGAHLRVRGREGGVYAFAIDTVAPTVRLKNIPANRNYSNRSFIALNISDDFSGISSYRCTIDGKWALFEYDPKNRELLGHFKYLKLNKGTRHHLVVTVADQLGNETVLDTTFFY